MFFGGGEVGVDEGRGGVGVGGGEGEEEAVAEGGDARKRQRAKGVPVTELGDERINPIGNGTGDSVLHYKEHGHRQLSGGE